METGVRFRTNIDCCKRFMGQISGMSIARINPLVGDLVRVYHDSKFDLYLKVVGREWVMTNGADPQLVVELHTAHGWTVSQLEAVMKEHGFR